ncbi:ABC transporter substrate-binding protein [Falsiroseomonas oryziterrae]|uniref:ABC transporter substrate-binding protein n=1 Tax=Falsiroseomonas oryziterrae TaxID=2911368 RepID=UPI001F3A6C09|nr:extracellular solute-binding protein [Roseomonas sp. NPKOSM-4]
MQFQLGRRALLGGAAAVAAAGSSRAQAAGGVTFVGWSHDEAASRPVLTEAFERFRAANPGMRLDTIGFPWAQMQQNLVLRIRSNQPMDVVQLAERWLPQFARVLQPADIREVLGAELERAIDPGLLRIGQAGGRQLGLPWTAASIGMVANRKVLADAGIVEMPRSVDAFADALRRIRRSQQEVVPYAFCTKNNLSISPDFQVWLWTFGGRVFDAEDKVVVDSEAGRAALSFLVELSREGLMARDVDRPDSRRLIAQHRTAFYHDAPLARGFARDNSGQGAAFDQHIAAFATPVLRAGEPTRSLMWGHLLVLPNPRGARIAGDGPAARFVRHMALDDETQLRYFRAVGLFPVTRTALRTLQDDSYVVDWTRNAGTAEMDEPSTWPNAADLTNIIGEEVQAALLLSKPPAQAIADMATRLRRATANQRRT